MAAPIPDPYRVEKAEKHVPVKGDPMDKPEKRIDLNSELGMTRRDLIRRGAIVGGTLLWVAPAIQSMAPKAFAQDGSEGSPRCAACYCYNGDKQAPIINRGFDGDLGSGSGLNSVDDCQEFCSHTGAYAGGGGASGGPYFHSDFCSATNCETNTQVEPGTNGAFCT